MKRTKKPTGCVASLMNQPSSAWIFDLMFDVEKNCRSYFHRQAHFEGV